LTSCATTPEFGEPGTAPVLFEVVSVEGAPACEAVDIDAGKDLLDRWIYLSRQLVAGTLTKEERVEGLQIEQVKQCVHLRGWIVGKVIDIDVPYFLIDYCRPGNPCVRAIQRPSGFVKN